MTSRQAPMCVVCVHFGEGTECDAFPDGVPMKILWEGFDHRKPTKGDHGIQFEADPSQSEEDVKITLAQYE